MLFDSWSQLLQESVILEALRDVLVHAHVAHARMHDQETNKKRGRPRIDGSDQRGHIRRVVQAQELTIIN